MPIRFDEACPEIGSEAMASLCDPPTPALLLERPRLRDNVARASGRCRDLGVDHRPHAKTHKCPEIGRLQLEAGAVGLTVATLEEARVFADAGFDDLTWAFPVVPGRIPEALKIAERATLRFLVDSEAGLGALEEAGAEVEVFLEVDTGDGRSGVDPMGSEAIRLARRLAGSSTLRFAGLLTHGGHTYGGSSRGEILAAARSERDRLLHAARRLRDEGLEVPRLTLGSTPGMAVVDHLDGIDEARAGNSVFFDLTQVELGSCRIEEVAVSVLATVVSSRPERGISVVDAGALALSKDPGPSLPERPTYGLAFPVLKRAAEGDEVPEQTAAGGAVAEAETEAGTPARVLSVSQEHGVVDAVLPVGSRVRILPNHSCLTVACHDTYVVVEGGSVVDRWRIHRERNRALKELNLW